MAARRKNCKCPMRARERGRNLVPALGDSYASAKYHKKKAGSQDPGGSSKPGQNSSPPHNNLLGCGESCKLCFVKYSINICHFELGRGGELCFPGDAGYSSGRNPARQTYHLGRVTAPWDADATSAPYFPNTPEE